MPVVQVEVAAEDAELAADALWAAGPSAVVEEVLPGGLVRLTADVAEPGSLDRRWPMRVLEEAEDAGLDGWRTWAQPHRAGRRLVLQPAWQDAGDADPRDLVVPIDPGRAFGSGSHPSTRSVAAVLEGRVTGGERVLDVGCGSGVLSVVACRLGAAEAVAVDLAPEAVVATEANASANGVRDRVRASLTPVEEVVGPFDLVVANIGLAVLRDLAVPLAAQVADDGVLVLAGLLDAQVDDVLGAYPDWRAVEVRSESGWSTLVLSRAIRRGGATGSPPAPP